MGTTFKYKWNIAEGYPARGIGHHKCKVFGTFICGGGSTMGYKLAGYDHLGGVEIDPEIASVYQVNHHPQHLFVEDLRSFARRSDLPPELFALDILDGSPPCSSFSLSGNRESDWGKHKVFREGQVFQRLDDLFFDYIDLAGRLQPKVVIAENVKGLISGNARAYVKEIIRCFQDKGYLVQVFLFNAASMGVPQKRERVFFICRRKDLSLPELKVSFSARPIPFKVIEGEVPTPLGKHMTEPAYKLWVQLKPGLSLRKVHPKGHFFNSFKISPNQVLPTIAANAGARFYHYKHPVRIHEDCLKLCGSFPMDYDFQQIDPQYLIGMSVPPVMMANISWQVYDQWLRHLSR